MSHGIRPSGKWNEPFVNKITFTRPEALKYVKSFTDFKASMVHCGSFMNHRYRFMVYDEMQLWRAYITAYLPGINLRFKSNSIV